MQLIISSLDTYNHVLVTCGDADLLKTTRCNLQPAAVLDASFFVTDPPDNVIPRVTTSHAHSLTVMSALSRAGKSTGVSTCVGRRAQPT
jgi:hypothetical protein